jgi:hypothetical protein
MSGTNEQESVDNNSAEMDTGAVKQNLTINDVMTQLIALNSRFGTIEQGLANVNAMVDEKVKNLASEFTTVVDDLREETKTAFNVQAARIEEIASGDSEQGKIVQTLVMDMMQVKHLLGVKETFCDESSSVSLTSASRMKSVAEYEDRRYKAGEQLHARIVIGTKNKDKDGKLDKNKVFEMAQELCPTAKLIFEHRGPKAMCLIFADTKNPEKSGQEHGCELFESRSLYEEKLQVWTTFDQADSVREDTRRASALAKRLRENHKLRIRYSTVKNYVVMNNSVIAPLSLIPIDKHLDDVASFLATKINDGLCRFDEQEHPRHFIDEEILQQLMKFQVKAKSFVKVGRRGTLASMDMA